MLAMSPKLTGPAGNAPMSSLVAFLANQLARLGNDAGPTTADGSGPSLTEPWGRWSHDGSWQRMFLGSWMSMADADSRRCFETWPAAGMMRSGFLFPLPLWVPPILGNAPGLSPERLAPTPQASDGPKFYYRITPEAARRRLRSGRQYMLGHWVVAQTGRPGRLNPAFSLCLMGYPPDWLNVAPAVTPSSPTSPTPSSKPSTR